MEYLGLAFFLGGFIGFFLCMEYIKEKTSRVGDLCMYTTLKWEEVEEMFLEGEPIDKNTPHGVIHMVPEPKHCVNFKNRRKADD